MNNKGVKQASLFGRFLRYLDGHLHNIKLFIKRHDNSIEVIFLMIYVFLNICLVLSIVDKKVSLFVVGLLFFIALERVIVHLKMRADKEDLNKREEVMKDKLREYDGIFYKIKNERDKFKSDNKILRRQKDYLLKELKEIKDVK